MKISPAVQTAAAVLATGTLNLIASNGLPHDAEGVFSLVASAAVGAGLLHITAPRNQGALIIKKDASNA